MSFQTSAAFMLLTLTATITAQADLREAVQKVLPATVMVQWSATSDAEEADPPMELMISSGSAVSADGLIVTFASEAQQHGVFTVTFPDGRSFPAKLLVQDRRSHLALLKIEAQDVPHIELAQTPAELGQPVMAVSATDARDRMVSQGIIASTQRSIAEFPAHVLQTDLNVQRMSAGAPLTTVQGQLLGVIVARESSSTAWDIGRPEALRRLPTLERRPSGAGLTRQPQYAIKRQVSPTGPAFAIPLTYVAALLEARQGDNSVIIHPGFLGVALGAGGKPANGATINGVTEGTPAADAGLRKGDTIVQVDEQEIESPRQLLDTVSLKPAGSRITIHYQRPEGAKETAETRQVEVVLDKRPAAPARAEDTWIDVELFNPADGNVLRVAPQVQLGEPTKVPYGTPRVEQPEGGWLILPRTTAEPPAVEPPVIRVRRTDSEQQLKELATEVRQLREQVEQLTEQIKALQGKD